MSRQTPSRPYGGSAGSLRGTGLLKLIFNVGQPILTGVAIACVEPSIRTAAREPPHAPPPSPPTPSTAPKDAPVINPEKYFVDALVAIGSCHQHSRPILSSTSFDHTTRHMKRRRPICITGEQARDLHQATLSRRPQLNRSPLSRDECLNMLDYYSEDYSTFAPWKGDGQQTTSGSSQTSMLQSQPSCDFLGSSPPRRSDTEQDLPDVDLNSDIQRLKSTLDQPKCTHIEAWEAYSSIGSRGIAHLSQQSRHRLMQCLSIIRKKNKESMFRYLSVVDDVKALGLPLTEAEWNSAIAFTAHAFERINAAGVESALLKWKEMEQQAQAKSGHVTFNILFDMATKAGKFVLAEMILKEMEGRGLKMNRHARVGMIYYQGLKGDGDGVRRAYREFVEAGEVVDTVVMNCVIASLIRAGELSAAEHVYERMKLVLSQHTGRQIPNLHWTEPRDLGRILDRAARKHRDRPDELRRLQEQQFLAPSQHTFAIFVEHHATRTGELRRIGSLLAEMQDLGVPMDGRIFVKIFKGFAFHGGERYTTWTKARLENVWESMLSILDQRLDSVKLNRWMAVWAMRAFEKCSGHEETLQIWEELRKRWKRDFAELATTQEMVSDLLKRAVKHAAAAPAKVYI